MVRAWWHFIRFVARICVWAYYRAFRVEGVRRIPRTGPVLFVVNHPNALVDAGAVLRAVPRPISFAAKHTLFTVPVLGWMLRKLGAVPVYRPSDRSGGARENLKMFSAFTELFRRGGAAVIFPEGHSHLDPELKEIKTGPARIALDAEEAAGFALGLRIVPIGLHYEPEQRFRGEVHVRVGESFDVADLAGTPRREAIRTVQARVAAALRPLVLHLEDVELEPLVRGIATVYDEHQRVSPGPLEPLSRAQVVQAAGACLNHFLAADPGAVRLAQKKLRHYERLAARAGFDGAAVEGRARPFRTLLKILLLLGGLLAGFPFFLVGGLTGYVPYRLTDMLARRYARSQGRVSLPILRIATGAVVFGAFWGVLTLLVFLWSRSLPFTAFFFAALVACGFFARSYAERARSWRAQLSALVAVFGSGIRRVARARRDLLALVSELVRRYRLESDSALLPARRLKWHQHVPWRGVCLAVLVSLLAWFVWGLRDVEVLELSGPDSPWVGLSAERARAVLEDDALALIGLLDTLAVLETKMYAIKADFEAGRRAYTNVEDDRVVRQAFLTYLNCRTTLFRTVWFYRTPDRPGEPDVSDQAFVLSYVAALELCRRGMQLVSVFADEPKAVRKLNEGDLAWGLSAHVFDRVRRNLANSDVYDELAAAAVRHRRRLEAGGLPGGHPWGRIWEEAAQGEAVVRSLADKLWQFKWDAAVARAGAAAEEGRYAMSRFFAGMIGGVRVRAGELAEGLVSHEQVEWLRREKLRPGDIVLERRNWALSNVFLPGFWTHAALYLGRIEDLRALGVEAEALAGPHLARLGQPDPGGRPRVILEALAPGVILNTLETSVGEADAVCVFRPVLSDEDIAAAMARALRHCGKPYDFDFDFFSSDRLVCTELVHQAYQGPIRLELQEIMGRETLPAIEIVRKWSRERVSEQAQLRFVCFLDSVEEEGVAREGTEEQLIATLARPGLTLLQSHGGSSRYPRGFLIGLASLLLLGLLFLRRR